MTKTKTLSLAAAGVLFAAAAGSASAQYAYGGYDNGYAQRTIRCESNDGRTRICSADTRGGVQLVDQTSQTSCIRGRTWGADQRGIWVTQGCRGVFAINAGGAYGGSYGNRAYGYGYGAYGNGYSNGAYNNGYYNNGYRSYNRSARVVRCESRDGRTRACSMDTRYGVSIVNQYSDSPCIEGSTWGADRNRVWVTRGCRADFAAGATGYGYNNGYYDRRY